MMWYWGGGAYWWEWLLGSLGMAVFWGLAIWAIWYFVTSIMRRPETSPRTPDPKRILDERLARGEVDEEEYRRLRALMTRTMDHSVSRNGEPTGASGVESGRR